MDKWLCFSIFDKKTAGYERPFFAKHVAEVTRQIDQMIQKGEAGFALYPEDFALYMIGEFDKHSGEMLSSPNPVHIIELAALKKVGV